MEAARDSGNAVASGRVQLVQERELPDSNKQSGFLIYVPVYRNNSPDSNKEERRKALIGFVYSPYRADDFFAPKENLIPTFTRVCAGTPRRPS